MTWAALVVAGLISLSIFLAVFGLPYSGFGVAEQCSFDGSCVQTSAFYTKFLPTSVAAIPILAGLVVAMGLVTKKTVISWAGTILLLGFSIVGLASIGLLFMPFAAALAGLLATSQRNPKNAIR